MKLLLTTSLLVSIGFGSATALAQTAGVPATTQASGQPGAAPAAALSPQLNQTQKLIQDATLQAQEAQKKAAAEIAERARLKRESLVRPAATPEERAARTEARKKDAIEATPAVKAALVQEAQTLNAQIAASRAAQEALTKAAAAERNATKLKNDAIALTKPNAARGANFTPQNVTPLLEGLDKLTKRLNTIKTPAELPPPQMAALGQELARLSAYMDRLEDAMDGVQLAGVETPANKEAATLFMRVEVLAKNLDAEMQRVEKILPNAPQLKAMFAKFRE